MKSRPKHLPRLWCALQGLLPLEACLAAQRGELAWPAESEESRHEARRPKSPLGTVAIPTRSVAPTKP